MIDLLSRYNQRLNQYIESMMTYMTPLALVTGYVFSDFFKHGTQLVTWLFAFVMFVMALGCTFGQLADVFRKPGVFIYVFLAAHVFLPFVAWAGGSALFGGDSPFVIGLLLFAVIPLGVSSIMWVGLTNGQVPLVLGLVILDSMIAPFFVPAVMDVLVGTHVEIDRVEMMQDLVYLLVIPTLLGVILQSVLKGKAKVQVGTHLAPWSKVAFASVLVINAASIKPYLSKLQGDLIPLLLTAALLIIIGYLSGYLPYLRQGKARFIHGLPYALGMRNISLGLVLALHYFEPLAAVPVILSILLQQPLAAIHYALIKRRVHKGD